MGTNVEARPQQKEKGSKSWASADPAWVNVDESRLTELADDREVRPRNARWPKDEDAKPKEDKPKQSWDDWRKSYTREGSWRVRLSESHDDKGYHGDTAISVGQ